MFCWLDLSKWMSWIGPNSWGSIRHLLPYHKAFHKCWCFHDQQYTLWVLPKKYIDDKFLEMMLGTKTWKPFAFLYYFLVKMFWWLFFNNKQCTKQ